MEMSNRNEPSSQPDQYQQVMHVYREAIQNISDALLRSNWSELRGTSPVFLAAQATLQDAISNLENLVSRPVEKNDHDAILENLNEALIELSSVAVLADQADVQQRLEVFHRINRCRQLLRLAVELMGIGR